MVKVTRYFFVENITAGLCCFCQFIGYQVLVAFFNSFKVVGVGLVHLYYHPLGIAGSSFGNGGKVLSAFACGVHGIWVVFGQVVVPAGRAILDVQEGCPFPKSACDSGRIVARYFYPVGIYPEQMPGSSSCNSTSYA